MMAALAGMFLAAFLAATLFPAQSEAVLVALLVAGEIPAVVLLVVATVGNVLGSVVNWAAGRWLMGYSDRRWFPVRPGALDRAQAWYARWGRWSLLASWMPFIGDPLTLAAGVMREPFWRFTLIVTLAKAGRYVVLVLATLALI